MGAGKRVREAFPDVTVAAAEPLPGDPVIGLRSLEDGYVPPILDVSPASTASCSSPTPSRSPGPALLEREAIFAGVSSGAVIHVARKLAELGEGVVVSILADGGWKACPRRSGPPRTWSRRWRAPSGGNPGRNAAPAGEHARAEAPNEACGLLAFRDGVAERLPARRQRAREPVPLRAEAPRPHDFFLEDEGYEVAVFHSHPTDSAVPSRTDLASIGLWEGRPYFILALPTGELRGWRIQSGRADELEVAE